MYKAKHAAKRSSSSRVLWSLSALRRNFIFGFVDLGAILAALPDPMGLISLCRFAHCNADQATIARLLEARRVYATGLLAIGLAANDACAEAVRNGMAVELAKV